MPIIAVSNTKRDTKKPFMFFSIAFQDTLTQSIDKIATRISEQMEKYLPFVKLENISFAPKGENLANENMADVTVLLLPNSFSNGIIKFPKP